MGFIPDADVLRYLSTVDICVDADPSNVFNDRCTMIKMMEYMALSKGHLPQKLYHHVARTRMQGSEANTDAAIGQLLWAARGGTPLKSAIVGDPNQVPSYSDHLREIADGKQVVFIPPTSDREVLFGMVKQARLFIFPSTYEAMSMVLLEAASLQAPIICSDIPKNKIVMQENALYFHSGDAIDLANQIQWALGHPGEMSSLGRKASIYVTDNLTWEKITKQYEEIHGACINRLPPVWSPGLTESPATPISGLLVEKLAIYREIR